MEKEMSDETSVELVGGPLDGAAYIYPKSPVQILVPQSTSQQLIPDEGQKDLCTLRPLNERRVFLSYVVRLAPGGAQQRNRLGRVIYDYQGPA